MSDFPRCEHHSGIVADIAANCRKIDQLEKLSDVKFDAIEDKMVASAEVLRGRLESLNQLRNEVTEDRSEFLRKETYDAKTTTYDTWIITVEKRFSTMETRSATWTAAVGVLFLIVQFALHWLRP
jgi:exo-beta-1,3-glucanase (GH17 family)